MAARAVIGRWRPALRADGSQAARSKRRPAARIGLWPELINLTRAVAVQERALAAVKALGDAMATGATRAGVCVVCVCVYFWRRPFP